MVDCVEVWVWEPDDGFPEEGEGSLEALLGEVGCMIEGVVWFGRARKGGVVAGMRMTLQKQAVG